MSIIYNEFNETSETQQLRFITYISFTYYNSISGAKAQRKKEMRNKVLYKKQMSL